MEFGFCELDLSPRHGMTAMSGYGRERYARGVTSPLVLQAAVIVDDLGRRHAIVAADLLGFDRSSTEAVRRSLAADGFDPERVLLNASHTHYGPPVQFSLTPSVGSVDPWYMRRVEDSAVNAVRAALGKTRAGELRVGGFDIRIGENRRLPAPGGAVMVRNPEGSYDTRTVFLWARPRCSGAEEIVLLAHGCHPVHAGAHGYCADYPGEFRRHAARLRPSAAFLFLQGCGADVNGPVKHGCAAEGKRLARELAARLSDAQTRPLSGGFACTRVRASLPLGPRLGRAQLERMAFATKPTWMSAAARELLWRPDRRRSIGYGVQAWRCGDFTLVALEGEVVSAYGPLTRRMAGRDCMVLGYSNAVECYVPTAAMQREGGYEVVESCWAYRLPARLGRGAPAAVTRAIRRALAGLGGKPTGKPRAKWRRRS